MNIEFVINKSLKLTPSSRQFVQSSPLLLRHEKMSVVIAFSLIVVYFPFLPSCRNVDMPFK